MTESDVLKKLGEIESRLSKLEGSGVPEKKVISEEKVAQSKKRKNI